jgi:hypothetical protein
MIRKPADSMGLARRLSTWAGVLGLLVQAYLPVHFAQDLADAIALQTDARAVHVHVDGTTHSLAPSQSPSEPGRAPAHNDNHHQTCLVCVGTCGPVPSLVACPVEFPAPSSARLAPVRAPIIPVFFDLRSLPYSPRAPPEDGSDV